MLVCPRCHCEVSAEATACDAGHLPPFWTVPGEDVFGWQLLDRIGRDDPRLYKASRGVEVAALQCARPDQVLDAALVRRYRSEPKVQQVLSSEPDLLHLLDVREEVPALMLEVVEWPTLRMLSRQRRIKRLEAVTLGRRIAGALGKLHALDFVHGAVDADHVLVEPSTLKVKLATNCFLRTIHRDTDTRAARLTAAADLVGLGTLLAEVLSQHSPPVTPLRTGEPDLDTVVADCLRALPTDHVGAAHVETELRRLEEKVELQRAELGAATAKLQADLSPWLQLRQRLADVDPDAGDPTLAEMKRRLQTIREIAADLEERTAKSGRPIAPAATPPPAGAGRFALGLVVGALLAIVATLGLVRVASTRAPGDAARREPGPPLAATAPSATPPSPVAPPLPVAPAAAPSADLGSHTPQGDASIPIPAALPAAAAAATCPDGMRFVPGGTPARGVPIAGFCIDATEVTLGDYEACVAAGKCRRRHSYCDDDGFAGSDPDDCDCTRGEAHKNHPANCLTSSLAAAYCAARGAELPSREQWQWALHGALPDRKLPWGDQWISKRACLGKSSTCPVAQFPDGASPQGVQDLVGGVAEWTRDHSANGTHFRDRDSASLDVAQREHMDADTWSDSIGFRCVGPAK